MHSSLRDSLSNQDNNLRAERVPPYGIFSPLNYNRQKFDPLFKHSLWTMNQFLQSGITGDALADFFRPHYDPSRCFWLDVAKPTLDDISYLQQLFDLETETIARIISHMTTPMISHSLPKIIHNPRYIVILAIAFDATPLTTYYSGVAAQLDAKDRPRLTPIEDQSSFSLYAPLPSEAHSVATRKLTDHRLNICAIALGDSLITLRLSALSYCGSFFDAISRNHHGTLSVRIQNMPVDNLSASHQHHMDYQQQNCVNTQHKGHQKSLSQDSIDGSYNVWRVALPRAFSGDVVAYPQIVALLYHVCFERLAATYFSLFQKETELFLDRFEESKLASITRIRFGTRSNPNPKKHQQKAPSLGEFWLQRRKLAHLRRYLVPHFELFAGLGVERSDACLPDALEQLAAIEMNLNCALEEHCQVAELALIASCSYRDALLKKLTVITFISMPISIISALFSMNIPLPWVYADPVALPPLSFLYHYNYSATPFYCTLVIMLILSLLSMLLLRNRGLLDNWNILF